MMPRPRLPLARATVALLAALAVHIGAASARAYASACADRHPYYVNVFPERMYCQSLNFTLGVDRLMLAATDLDAGEPRAVHLADASALTLALELELELELGLGSGSGSASVDPSMGAVAIAGTVAVPVAVPRTYSAVGYLSNLYAGDRRAGSPFDKRWARFSYTVGRRSDDDVAGADAGTGAPRPLLLLRDVVYLAPTEGAADRYPHPVASGAPESGGAALTRVEWRYADCANGTQVRSRAAGGRTYAYWDAELGAPACACQRHFAFDPHTARCVAGCARGGPEPGQGYCGAACATLMGPGTARSAYAFYAETSALVDRDTCAVVCLQGYAPHNGVCRATLRSLGVGLGLAATEPVHEVHALSMTLVAVVFVCILLVAALAMMAILCGQQQRATLASSPPPSPTASASASAFAFRTSATTPHLQSRYHASPPPARPVSRTPASPASPAHPYSYSNLHSNLDPHPNLKPNPYAYAHAQVHAGAIAGGSANASAIAGASAHRERRPLIVAPVRAFALRGQPLHPME